MAAGHQRSARRGGQLFELGFVAGYLVRALKTTLVAEQITVNPAPDARELSTVVLTAAPPAEPSVQTPEPDAECFILAERIQALMDEQRPHLNSQITLERFAHLLGSRPPGVCGD